MTDLYHDLLLQMNGKMDTVISQQATLAATQAATNEKLDAHLKSDQEKHDEIDEDVDTLKTWRTQVVAKVGTYAAVASAVFAFVFGIAKDALAALLSGPHH